MAAPVVGVQFHLPADGNAGAVAHQCPLWRTELETRCVRLELVEDRIEQRGMKGMAGVQPLASNVVGRQPGHRPLQVLRRTGQHGVGTVVGRHGQPRELVGAAFNPVGIGEHGDHPTAGGQTAEQSAALGEQPSAVLEAEHTRDAGRRILTDAVAQHHVRFESPRLPEPGQAHFHREQRGLGIRGVPQRVDRPPSAPKMTSSKRLFEYVVDCGRAPGHRLGEHRLGRRTAPRPIPAYWLP